MSVSKVLSGEPLPRIPPIDLSKAKETTRELNHFHKQLIAFLRRLSVILKDEIILSSPSLAGLENSWHIETPTAKTYTIVEYSKYQNTLNKITHKTSSGGCTIAVKINGVTVTGTGDSTPSTSQSTLTFTAANVCPVGGRITIVVSGLSSPADLCFTLDRTVTP